MDILILSEAMAEVAYKYEADRRRASNSHATVELYVSDGGSFTCEIAGRRLFYAEGYQSLPFDLNDIRSFGPRIRNTSKPVVNERMSCLVKRGIMDSSVRLSPGSIAFIEPVGDLPIRECSVVIPSESQLSALPLDVDVRLTRSDAHYVRVETTLRQEFMGCVQSTTHSGIPVSTPLASTRGVGDPSRYCDKLVPLYRLLTVELVLLDGRTFIGEMANRWLYYIDGESEIPFVQKNIDRISVVDRKIDRVSALGRILHLNSFGVMDPLMQPPPGSLLVKAATPTSIDGNASRIQFIEGATG